MLMSSRHCCLCGSSEASEWYIEDVESKADGITKLLQFEADIRIVGVAQFAALVASGDREGQHSLRINDQYRICFV